MSEQERFSGDRVRALRLALACVDGDAGAAEAVLADAAGVDGGLANLALGSARLAADALSHGGDRSPVAAGEALLLRLDRELGGVS